MAHHRDSACNMEILPERPDAQDSFKYFFSGENPGMFYDQLFQAAHHTLPRVWNTRYPAEQLLDDLENLRALDLIHECSKLRFKVEVLDRSSSDLPLSISHMTSIREDLRRTREKFEDLLRIAHLAQVPGTALRRVVRTTLIAATNLYGMEIFCHRVVCRQLPERDCHQSSLNDLMGTAKKTLDIDMRLLGRICWALLLASMETKDMAPRAWIGKIFEEMSAKHGSLYGIERRLNMA
ncbi:hypothetical protein N7451_005008 [Penicillium sp. IBT 35674x]|nr:hypothetical protein N7451_005008 [Penicillium sp. IBT 35674x]